MRLNNCIRERVRIFLIDKVFPKSKEENLVKNLRLTIESSDMLDSRRQIYSLYPEYVRKSSTIRFERRIRYSYNNYDETQRVDISISFDYGVKSGEWGYIEFNIDNPEFKAKYPLIYNDAVALMDFEKSRAEYRKSIKNVLSTVQSSTPLIKLIPECSEFFKSESHGVTGATSLVPMSDLKIVRDYLAKAEEEANE